MGQKEFKVGIVGGTSLLAGSLVRILLSHPFVKLEYLSSDHGAGLPVADHHKIFHKALEGRTFDAYDPDRIQSGLDLVFIAKPHAQAMNFVKELYNGKLKIIDLSGDFRLREAAVYEKWYKARHIAPELLDKSVYGLTEIRREDIGKAVLVANPGCYPTGIVLSLYPLLKEKVIETSPLSITSYSGVSGAGKNPVPGKNLFMDAFNNIMAYKIASHQHIPEIEEQLSLAHGGKVFVDFVPHLASMDNGIFNTIYTRMKRKISTEQAVGIFRDAYASSRFVRVCAHEPPRIRDVADSNYFMVCPVVDSRTETLLLFSALDNRIKGGAGQAVQNMNLMFGLPEETGFSV